MGRHFPTAFGLRGDDDSTSLSEQESSTTQAPRHRSTGYDGILAQVFTPDTAYLKYSADRLRAMWDVA